MNPGSEKKAPEGKVVSVRFSQSATTQAEREKDATPDAGSNKRYGYSFYLREADGGFIFDAFCLFVGFYKGAYLDREFKSSAAASQKDMEALRKICEKNGFAQKWGGYTKKKTENTKRASERQGEINLDRLEIIWENGALFDALLYHEWEYLALREWKSFFVELAKRSDKTTPAAGKIVSFCLEGRYFAREQGKGRFIPDRDTRRYDSYEYIIREENGNAQFCAYDSGDPRINQKKMFPIDNARFETLRALCEKYSIAEKIHDYYAQRWDDFDRSSNFIYDLDPSYTYGSFEIEWENGARCEGTALRNFFSETLTLPEEIRNFFSETLNGVLPRPPGDWKCACGASNKPAYKFCAECGNIKSWACPCGHTGNNGKFCCECGKPSLR